MGAKFFEVEHGTEAWRTWRAGKITGSRAINLLATGANGWGVPAMKYADELAVELCTGLPYGADIDAPALRWGREQEPFARDAYILETGHHVVKPNRVYYRDGMFVGGSPDGEIEPNGGMEIKCPKDPRVHLETLSEGTIPVHHIPQVQWYMWLTERDWWDFVSYDPRFKEAKRLFIQRIPRNDAFITRIAFRVQEFQKLVIAKAQKGGYEGDPFNIAPPVVGDPEVDTSKEPGSVN